MIIPTLYDRQKARGGYLTEADMHEVAELCGVPLYRIESLVSFFPHFRREPPSKVRVEVCRDMSCHRRQSGELIENLTRDCANRHGADVEVVGVSCLGRCDRAVATMINEQLYVGRSAAETTELIDQFVDPEQKDPEPDTEMDLAQSRAGPWQINVYSGQEPTYDAVRQYVRDPRPAAVLDALQTAGLLGMGGAGGRAYKKWGDVLNAEGTEKYVVCNADESEPGTFKDREILLATPHLIVEGMILAGLVVGARRGWIYIRHEYHEQAAAIEREIARARSMGLLGLGILDSAMTLDLEVFVSPGGYICGEQTALIEAMEDRRAEPRNRPPELMTNGLRDQPTLLNNVETFAWVPAIMLRSAGQWYADQGNKGATLAVEGGRGMNGMRLFSISGDVANPGVYEVPTGTTLGELIHDCCGGMAAGQTLQAVALSGPSGGLLPAKVPVKFLNRRFVEQRIPDGVEEIPVLDIPLDIQVARSLGLMIGAGIVVYGSDADIVKEVVACSQFFRNESCGKCVPCRIGSQKITEMGEQIESGRVDASGLPVLRDTAIELSKVMTATSICGLGQVASNPVRSLLNYFPDQIQRPGDSERTEGDDG